MRNNALTICCGVCVAGAFGVFTRWMQDLTAFDEHGLYVRGNIWGAVLLLLCIAAAGAMLGAFANLSSLEVSGRPEEAAALALRVSEALAEGAYVVIAGDRIPIASARSAVLLSFMGREAPFPTGGALLALLARAPLRTMISARIDRPGEPRTYRVRFRSIDEAPSAARRERRAWLESAMRRYGAALEADLRDSPYDWFNFYDFWNPGC